MSTNPRAFLWVLGSLLVLCGCQTDWYESFDYKDKGAHDLYILHELLSSRPAGLVTITDSLTLLSDSTRRGNYLFVGKYAHYPERSVTQLLDFVERGNTAFIAARALPEDLAYHLFGDQCFAGEYLSQDERFPRFFRDTVTLLLPKDTFLQAHLWDYEVYDREANYLEGSLLCDPALDHEILGFVDYEYINFVRLGWGAGDFFFNAQPLSLTNYYLADSLRARYAAASLSVLGEGPIYWDEASRTPPPVTRARNPSRQDPAYDGGRNLLKGNPALSYIQQQPALALAWYTLLATALLFILLRGRRRQRIIPLMARRENTSRRFIDTLSRLRRRGQDHAALAQREIDHLRYHLNERFALRWKEGAPPPEQLAQLTGLPEAIIARAVAEIQLVQSGKDVDETRLFQLHRALAPLFRS